MKHLEIQLNAGLIKRYHNFTIIGEQTVASHTYGVCQILRYTMGDRVPQHMIFAALDHDVPEYYTGDIPYGVKANSIDIQLGVKDLEKQYVEDGGTDYRLTPMEKDVLKFADLMEMGLFGVYQMTLGNQNGIDLMRNVLKALPDTGLTRADKMKAMLQETLDECE